MSDDFKKSRMRRPEKPLRRPDDEDDATREARILREIRYLERRLERLKTEGVDRLTPAKPAKDRPRSGEVYRRVSGFTLSQDFSPAPDALPLFPLETPPDTAPAAHDVEPLPWATRVRLAFIEEAAFWLNSVNRRDLVERFAISEQQASGDFTRYQELAPGNLVYDKSAKTYQPATDFTPRFFRPDSEELLSRLRLTAEGISGDHPLLGSLSLGVAPSPARPVDPETLRVIIRAIREARQVSAHYVSFSQTDGRMRRIEPHALGYDGFRWHARARDADDGAFKDYVMGRLSGANLLGPAEAPSTMDQDWHGWVTLTITPNPGLSPAQKKVIERDYGMRGGIADLKVRKALAYYTKHRLGLDLDSKARRPEDQHVVLVSGSNK